MPDEHDHASASSERPSPGVEAAAIRWSDAHPDDDVDHPPPAAPAEPDGEVPNRHSASAEAASLRWQERNADE